MAKYDAFGTKLKKGIGGTEIAQVTNISGPGISLDTEDVTSHDSSGAWEEHVGTILRSGEVTVDLVFDPANATHADASGLLYQMVQRTDTEYELVFPDGATSWSFQAFVVGFEPAAPVGGALTAVAKLKITGVVDLSV